MKKIISLVLSVVMIASVLVTGAFAEAGLSNFKKTQTYKSGTFTDFPTNAWFAKNAAEAYEYALMKGVSATDFGSAQQLKICEGIAMAARLHSIYNTGKADFKEGTPWYQVYVDYAITNKIIGKNRFENYEAYATRNQFAEIFADALPNNALKEINNIPYGKIPDVKYDVPNEHIYKLYRAGILAGKTAAGDFCPADPILRSECAALVTRMANETLRVKFSIQEPSDNVNSATELLTGINSASQATLFAIQCCDLSIAKTAAAMLPGADVTTLTAEAAAASYKAAEYTLMAAKYAQNAEKFCENNSKFAAARSDLSSARLACMEASLKLKAPSDVAAAKIWLVGVGDALSRANDTATALSKS
ncbi:MAG: hypothetical protein RSC86_02830 [Oscillospiraceae bacterium]